MMRIFLSIILILVIVLSASSCTVSEATKEIPVITNFGRMLKHVPVSFLLERDVFFADYGMARNLHGAPDLTSLAEIQEITDDQKELVLSAMDETDAVQPEGLRYELYPITGFGLTSIDRYLTIGAVPPKISDLFEGDFNEELIREKLTGLEYNIATYESHDYFTIRGDYEQSITHPLSRMVFARMNRAVVEDDFIITSPATGDIEGFFNTSDGNLSDVMESLKYKALVDSLGDVLVGTLTTPERLILSNQDREGTMMFYLPAADNWGTLKGYQAAALGYRSEGNERYLDIALYYADAADAATDGDLIIERMNDYLLNTFTDTADRTPFTDRYEPGEPSVREYDFGAVLLISCRILPREHFGISGTIIGGAGFGFRDLLFLVPDPGKYTLE